MRVVDEQAAQWLERLVYASALIGRLHETSNCCGWFQQIVFLTIILSIIIYHWLFYILNSENSTTSRQVLIFLLKGSQICYLNKLNRLHARG